jgi:hypothetical protein
MENIEEKVFEYLDELRESGVTNMYGAIPYIQQKFPELTISQSSSLLVEWMKTFSERHKHK